MTVSEEEVITHSPYIFVNFKQGSCHMVRMASDFFFQQLVEPVASLVVPAMVSRE